MKSLKTMVFIDTCSFLASCWSGDERRGEAIRHDAAKEKTFWGDEFRGLVDAGRLILPRRNYEELLKHSKSRRDTELAARSKYVLDKLAPLIGRGTFEIVGDDNDPFADAILLSVALKFRTQHNLLFITQDRALARDLQSVSEFESVQPRGGQAMRISRISRAGRLESFGEPVRPSTAGPRLPSSGATSVGSAVKSEADPTRKLWWERLKLERS